MKKLIVLWVWLGLVGSAGASIDFKTATDIIGLSGQVVDTNALNTYQIPDSVRIVVTFHGMECIDAWYNAGDAEADSSNGILTWYDAVGDVDADSGAGLYTVTAMFYDVSNGTYTNRYYQFYLGTQSVNMASASNDALDLTTDICNILADSNVATIAVNVASADNDAIDLTTDICNILADSNIASITVADVNVGSVSNDAIDLTTDICNILADSNVATLGVDIVSASNDAIDLTTDICNILADSNVATIDVNMASASNDALDLTSDICNVLADSNVASITVADVNVGSVSNDALDLTTDVCNVLADSNIATIDVNVTSTSNDAIDLVTDICNVLADSNIATIGVDVVSAGNDAIDLTTDICNVLADSNVASIAVVTDSLSANANFDLFNYDVAQFADSTYTKFGARVDAGLDTSLFGYAEDVWTNIDTTTTIDTSDVGDWLVAHVGTATSNWNDTQRDSVLTALARLDNPLDVNMSQISGDATAADNLETMLDATGGATLSLGRLNITGANGASGSLTVTNTSGAGAVITSSSGSGATITGTTNGLTIAGGTADGINITSTTGDGVEIDGGSDAADYGLVISGAGGGARIAATNSYGLAVYGGSNTSSHAVYLEADATSANAIKAVSTVSGAAGVAITGGGAAGGTDLDLNIDSTNFMANAYIGMWDQVPFGTSFKAGSLADSINNSSYMQGAASGLDSAKVVGAVINAFNKDTTAHFKQIIVRSDGATNDSGAVGIYNTSSSSADHALALIGNAGNGLYHYSTSNSAVEFSTPSGNSQPTVWYRHAGTGEAAKFTAVGNNAVELTTSSATAGHASLEISNTGAGYATRLYADTGDALLIQIDTGTNLVNNAIQVEGRTYLHNRGSVQHRTEDAILVEAQRSGRAFYLLSDSSTAFRISGDSGIYILTDSTDAGIIGGIDTLITATSGSAGSDTTDIKTMLEGNPGIVGSDTTSILALAEDHPAVFYGPSGSGAGSGSYSVVIYAADTAGTDAVLADVKVTAQDAAGGIAGWDYTNSSGYVTLALDPATYTILARKIGYFWDNSTLVVSGNATDTAYGYDTETENVCRIYGYVKNVSGNGIEYATVTATMPGRVYDSCAATLVFDNSVQTTTTTDGYFELDLIRSSCLNDKAYKISWSKRDVGEYSKQFTVPDSTTYLITW